VSFVCSACALLACAGNPPPEVPDDSAGTRAAAPRRAPPRWSRFDEVAGWPPVNPTPFVSKGHGASRTLVSIRVSASVAESYRGLRPDLTLPTGTIVAAFHTDAKTGAPGPVYVMEREADRWKYSALDADGRTSEHGLALCERCHAESPTSGLFGLPR
jgi:hypothetical protein